MRVALLSYNAQLHNAIGNQVAEKVRFFQERGAEVRVYVQDARRLHADLHTVTSEVHHITPDGPVWDYLRQADLVIAVYAQACELWQYLPMLTGLGPRILFDYHGVTPPNLWHDQQREGLHASQRERGYVWFADHAITASEFTCHELQHATKFDVEQITAMPLPIDLAHFRPNPGERYLHDKLGIAGRILLYVGRFAGNKRVPILIDALAAIADTTLHAIIVGDASDFYAAEQLRCEELARTLGVGERVHFLTNVADADLPRVYQSADVFVVPSLHEGFCVPVVEAMACGVPVIASRSAALPETIADAGLTFVPDDAADLARQLRRVLSTERMETPPRMKRVAVVSFRFGSGIVGGAETSLGVMARALHDAGHDVRVFTTCTASESGWTNELPAGNVTIDGLQVERFPIDPHDAVAHGQTVRAILDADGRVSPEIERQYLEQSIHSSALLGALRECENEFDAILVGPYLFGLTVDIVTAFSRKTLLVPCFHDEALARLSIWARSFSTAGGLLYHSPEEKDYAQRCLGVNHPNAREIGTYLPTGAETARLEFRRRGVVYCGRYSTQKNVPLLLDWARYYQAERPEKLDFIFMGQGDVTLPREPWLRDLGRVENHVKQAVLGNALALVQLSTNESLSIVALEAWARSTPVIAHHDCAVLRGQIARSRGGATVADYAAFAAVLDDLQANQDAWRERGESGRAYVGAKYGSIGTYTQTLTDAIDTMHRPLAEQMRASGIRRAHELSRERWQERFAELIDRVLSEPTRCVHAHIEIEPLRVACHSSVGTRTLLLPIRLRNVGTHAAASDGPARTMIACEIVDADTKHAVAECQWTNIGSLLAPGQTHTVALPITLPDSSGTFVLRLGCVRPNSCGASAHVEVPLVIAERSDTRETGCASSFLDCVQETLPITQQLQQLPSDYVDVTEGRFAPVKRWIKRKLLNNFKQAYVDGLSRQQSQVNGQMVVMIQQLAECCSLLDHAVQGLHRRLDGLETKMEQIASDHAAQSPTEEIHG